MDTLQAQSGRSSTVLIVDDSRELLALITESLTLLGDFTVLTAEDGADGLGRAVATESESATMRRRIRCLSPHRDGKITQVSWSAFDW